MVHFVSSGHPQADRRYDMAMQFFERGDFEAAADLLGQARELAGTWGPAIFKHGEILMPLGRREEAINALKDYLLLEPADPLGARIKLAIMGEPQNEPAISEQYVAGLFNDYAEHFEKHLTKILRYDVPAEIARIIDTLPSPPFMRIADLGCGTGLAGVALKHRAAWLEGIDLSAQMILQAEKKAIYDRLQTANLFSWLQENNETYDLLVAADVLIYVGDLTAFLEGAAARLVKGGLLTFSVQITTDDKNFILGADHRYSHSDVFVSATATNAQLGLLYKTPHVIRKEAGTDVAGMIYVFRK
jgi:predicted TPR repeat methyltransferase